MCYNKLRVLMIGNSRVINARQVPLAQMVSASDS